MTLLGSDGTTTALPKQNPAGDRAAGTADQGNDGLVLAGENGDSDRHIRGVLAAAKRRDQQSVVGARSTFGLARHSSPFCNMIACELHIIASLDTTCALVLPVLPDTRQSPRTWLANRSSTSFHQGSPPQSESVQSLRHTPADSNVSELLKPDSTI